MARLLSLLVLTAVCVGVAVRYLPAATEGEDSPIKTVMQEAHKKPLLKNILAGSGSKEDKEKLLGYYVTLYQQKAAKGDAADWQKRTGDLLAAAAMVVVNREGAADKLKAATNCKACHDLHK